MNTITNTQYDMYRVVFNEICAFITDHSPEWTWKELVSYEETYTDIVRMQLVVDSIAFFVGGKTDIYITTMQDGSCIVGFVNRGYYVNIGA